MKIRLLFFLTMLFTGIANAQFTVVQPDDLVQCSVNDFSVFDLTTQNTVILGSLTPGNYTITYHTSSSAANSDLNPIANPQSYTNSNSPQPIWARVELNSNPADYEIAEFHLRVHLTPPVSDQTFSTCDVDSDPTDGMTTFDLGAVAEQIWSAMVIPPNQVQLLFYMTEADAATQANPLLSAVTTTMPNQVIYVNSMYYETGCFSISQITLNASNCAGSCMAPTNLAVTNLTNTTATFSWTSTGDETAWEMLILPNGGPFPLPTMQGMTVTNNPVVFDGLDCDVYDVYIRSLCDANTTSNWSMPVTFEMNDCDGNEIDQPTNLNACAVDGLGCFDLTVNDAEALGIDATEYQLSYFETQADAEAEAGTIANPEEYCMTAASGMQQVFIRVENIESDESQIVSFYIAAQEVLLSALQLQPLVECDEDVDGSVVFNLTDVESQFSTGNTFTYYTDLTHAQQENDPVANPNAYSMQTVNSLMTIYIRESVPDACDIIFAVQLHALTNCNASNECVGANSLCNALGVPFTNTIGLEEAESGNDYGCLSTTPNPTWFYLPISGEGTVNLVIEQSTDIDMAQLDLDVDYIIYGPYDNPVMPCSDLIIDEFIVDCSYSADFVEYPVIPNAQSGEFYLIMVTNYSNDPGYIRISELGSSQGEIDCTGLRLTAFVDTNSNGTKDAGEANFSLGQFQYELNNSAVIHNITSPTGVHQIYDINVANSYDLSYTIDPGYAAYYGITTASYSNVSVIAGAGLQDYFFPVTINQAYTDVAVTVVPVEAPRPGFTYTNLVIYTNLGSQPVASGNLVFHRDPHVSFVSISEPGAVITANGFTYNYSNLGPFETRIMTVVMQVPTIPAVELGDMLTTNAEITPFAGDLTSENNSSEVVQEVIGSYDPNDKAEAHGGDILFSDFSTDDYLYYTIRFENTGTASAINVNVVDVLNDQVDAESVRMVSASHPYVLDRVGSQLNWKFENILLPPVTPGSEDGHGYITFKVKPVPSYAVGDIIPNTANIYFDFNPAIVTNTFMTEFVSSLAVNEFKSGDFVVYPNPADAMLNVSLLEAGTIRDISIYDISGKTIQSQPSSAMPVETIDVSNIASGVYFIQVTTDAASKVVRKIVIQ
ncbi:MAG TPA: T9SS type A sorting domain-containing protein [Flavobacterium sp.]|jgi:uncharacterized repeat protein (TIGR01451 family)